MDFHDRVKQELYGLFPHDPSDARGEWAGLLRGGGVYCHASTGETVSLTHRDLALVKKMIHLQKNVYPSLNHTLFLIEREGLQRGCYYRVDFTIPADHRIKLELDEEEEMIFRQGVRGFDHYIRGLIEARGYLGNPRRAYHLEFPVSTDVLAEQIRNRLQQESLEVAIRRRKDEFRLYTKKGNMIGAFLGFIGAFRAYLDLEKIMVEKSTVNDITRWVNCETANLDKIVSSSFRIRRIIASIDLGDLPSSLREVAQLRMKYPFLSLRELGTQCRPALTKSEVFRRLKQIELRAMRQGVDRV